MTSSFRASLLLLSVVAVTGCGSDPSLKPRDLTATPEQKTKLDEQHQQAVKTGKTPVEGASGGGAAKPHGAHGK